MSATGLSVLRLSESLDQRRSLYRGECSFWTHEKLRNADTDQFRHVNNAVISTLLESARMEILDGDPLKASMSGRNVVVAHLSMDFLKQLYFPGTVEIGSATVKVGRTSFQLAQGLFIGSDCMVFALATCVLLDAKRGEPTPIPEPIRTHLLSGLSGATDVSVGSEFSR
ncbi:acyl-CoA thioesterase [Paraburkholderia sp. RP-4-7]|uniref:Acyl-CoA thioesterase n=1 Tax=Paraburkholderia polaris TaxID=2728848 RepID=A0A848IMG6_9BURK|nr:acyl-CoA thioesterase [Paraburkholderia polaris]NMM03518.1 acyl-CoA thioesterase [Paraburkholderia polaris]